MTFYLKSYKVFCLRVIKPDSEPTNLSTSGLYYKERATDESCKPRNLVSIPSLSHPTSGHLRNIGPGNPHEEADHNGRGLTQRPDRHRTTPRRSVLRHRLPSVGQRMRFLPELPQPLQGRRLEAWPRLLRQQCPGRHRGIPEA